MSKHTETPWTDETVRIMRADMGPLSIDARCLSEENWQHAKKCVNEHETLKADRKGLNDTVNELMEFVKKQPCHCSAYDVVAGEYDIICERCQLITKYGDN